MIRFNNNILILKHFIFHLPYNKILFVTNSDTRKILLDAKICHRSNVRIFNSLTSYNYGSVDFILIIGNYQIPNPNNPNKTFKKISQELIPIFKPKKKTIYLKNSKRINLNPVYEDLVYNYLYDPRNNPYDVYC